MKKMIKIESGSFAALVRSYKKSLNMLAVLQHICQENDVALSMLPDEVCELINLDPAEIEKTWRVLPMGYWTGSGLSIMLDLIATVLTNGNSVQKIGTFGDEVGLTQIMIAVDPTKFQTAEETDKIVDEILADIKSSEPVTEGGEVFYPGELELNSIRDNKEHGIPVIEEVWESVLKM